MNALGRILSGLEGRSLAEPSGSVIASLSDGVTSSGRYVSIRGSLHLVPVFSSVSLISASVGSLPLMVYRRLDAGDRERARAGGCRQRRSAWPATARAETR